MIDIPLGVYRPFNNALTAEVCNCTYQNPYNEECKYYHKEYHMGGYISTCLKQDIFGWCNCEQCKNFSKEK